jgi:hypothetical protein
VGAKGRVATLLGVDERDIWPAHTPPRPRDDEPSLVSEEVVAVWAHRADVPKSAWRALLSGGDRNIDLLGYAMQFLPEDQPGLIDLLLRKAKAGCLVRVALADPDAPHVAERDAEEGLGGTLRDRIRTTIEHLRPLSAVPDVEVRFHRTPMYNSVFRADDAMFYTPHLFALQGYRAPLYQLRRCFDDGPFDALVGHFERLWALAEQSGR